MDKELNMDEMKRIAEIEKKRRESDLSAYETTETVGSDWINRLKELSNEQEHDAPVQEKELEAPVIPQPIPVQKSVEESDEEEYDGPGVVIDTNKSQTVSGMEKYGVINPNTMENIEKYMSDIDEEIADAEKEKEKIEEIERIDERYDDSYRSASDKEKEFMDRYDAASEVIVKTGVGSVVNFTLEEREKLERARKIKLEEIETKEIKTVKTKRLSKKDDLEKIIKRVNNSMRTPIVLPMSGYTATMMGCSGYELMTLMDTKGNAVVDTQNKWSVIHSKIESTSIGKMDFNTFLHNTAAADYNIFLYGIICATYPDDDSVPVTCPNDGCKNTYDHHYSIRSLIRAEEMSERLRDEFMKIADSSANLSLARKCHEEACINQMKSIVLPSSEYIAEIYVQSAYDLINRSIKGLNDNRDNKFAEAAILSTMINRILIPDTDENDGSYFEVDHPMEVGEIIFNLPGSDISVLRTVADDMFGDMIVNFGLMNIKCPNCGHFTPSIPMELEQLLFLKYRREMNMTTE